MLQCRPGGGMYNTEDRGELNAGAVEAGGQTMPRSR